jgi:hypothetical protein
MASAASVQLPTDSVVLISISSLYSARKAASSGGGLCAADLVTGPIRARAMSELHDRYFIRAILQ